jgi:flagellar L-ring protein FlgH
MRFRVVQMVSLCGLTIAATAAAQDMRENLSRSLFADQKAYRAGDAVMIYIVESTSASNNATTSASRTSDLSLTGSGTMSGKAIPGGNVALGTGNTFKGDGSIKAQGSLTARISARVDSVLPNGNLIIRGSRVMTINGEDQTIRISGIVRPSDIQSDNSVYSYNISDANIALEGSGIVSRSQSPGWLTKFFHWIF